MRRFVIGTRGSSLALRQAEFIKQQLTGRFDFGLSIEIITTRGDINCSVAFTQMEGSGFFTKELEAALIRGDIDIAVHSLKDLMTTMPDELIVPAVGFREDRRELLLVNHQSFKDESPLPVKSGTIVGSSSPRRKCQLKHFNESLEIRDIRGNVPTRVEKLRRNEFGAILIAAAGVKRLGLDLSGLISVYLDPQVFLPAPGQGVLAIQSRRDDDKLNSLLTQIDDQKVRTEVELERGLLKKFNRGCSLPLGVFSEVNDDQSFHLQAVLDITDNGLPQLRRADIYGNDTDTIVNKTFEMLTITKVSV